MEVRGFLVISGFADGWYDINLVFSSLLIEITNRTVAKMLYFEKPLSVINILK